MYVFIVVHIQCTCTCVYCNYFLHVHVVFLYMYRLCAEVSVCFVIIFYVTVHVGRESHKRACQVYNAQCIWPEPT